MPQYTIPLAGGGSMTVNASSQSAAENNVQSTGNTPASSGGGGGGGGGGSAPSSSGSSGGSGTYQTVNGQQTIASMAQQLQNVGWGGNTSDPAAVAAAYASTTGGAVTPSGSGGTPGGTPSGTPGGAAPTTGGTSANMAAVQAVLQDAQQKAYQAYLNARLNLDTDTLAFQKATEAFNETVTSAGLTGTFQGAPTQAAMQFAANTFGTWGTPQPGQQTLAAQQQAFSQAQNAAQLTGWYTPPSYSPVPPITGPASGQMQAAPQAPWTGGVNLPTGTVVRTNANQFGVVGANGQIMPQTDANWPQIYQAIQNNQGIATITDQQWASAIAGPPAPPPVQAAPAAPAQGEQGAPGTGIPSNTGQPGQGPIETLAANQQYYQQWLDAQKQSLAQWQAQQTAGQNYLTMMAGLRGPADWIQYQKVMGATPQGLQDLTRAAAGQYIPGGGATTGVQPQPVSMAGFVNSATGGQSQGYAPYQYGGQAADQNQAQQFQNTLVAPNQMAPQTWNNLTNSQQQMLLGTWQAQGYTQDDAKQLFQQSLPKYATGAQGAGSFRLT